MSFKHIYLSILIILNTAKATEFYVTSSEDISSAMTSAQPGDTLTMANGIWHDSRIVFSGNGQEGSPILLRAETAGYVNLTGTSRLNIAGSYLVVDGLRFINGYSSTEAIIQFRNGSSNLAHHCRLTNTAIINNNPQSLSTSYKWVSIYGTYNEVDHCYFKGKRHHGALLVVWRNTPTADYHHIHHNYFADRPLVSSENGYETIRIGTSDLSLSDSYSIIESNYFEACDGEIEIISNKSGENIYRYNTFYNCEGTLTLRHGNNCQVYNNYFDGHGNSRSGGIRVIGEDHIIYNNFFTRLGGSGSRSALSMENGVPDSPLNRYFQVVNARILFNTFADNNRNFNIGTGADSERSLPPLDCIIGNNVVYGTTGPLINQEDEPNNLSWLANIFYGASLGITQADGITMIDPQLNLGEDGLWRPDENSPLKDAAEGEFLFISQDFDGQVRTAGEYDIGSDEISMAAILRRPVTTDSVGPIWLKDASIPKSLTVFIEGEGDVTLDPAGGVYEPQTWVKITAVPQSEWAFREWTGDLIGTNSADSIFMDTDKTITAHFDPPVLYSVDTWITGQGHVEFDPPGNSYMPGTLVNVSAVPESGWEFDKWGGALSGSQNPDTVIMNDDKAIIVTFTSVTPLEDSPIMYTYNLDQNYPNPFNPKTKIAFSLAEKGKVTITIHDMMGKRVKTLANQSFNSGTHQIEFDGSPFPSGVYFYKIQSAGFTESKKMLLIK